MKTLLALLFALPLLAQPRREPVPFQIYPRYMDAQGCANYLSLNLPNVTDCIQNISVAVISTDLDTQTFGVVITYIDEQGKRQIRGVSADTRPLEGAVGTTAIFKDGVQNVTHLRIRVIDDKGREVATSEL